MKVYSLNISLLRRIGVLFLFWVAPFLFYGQVLKQLETQKKKTEQEIEYASKLLEETRQSSAASLSRLRVLNKQIQLQKKIIRGLNQELEMLEKNLNEQYQMINAYTRELEKVKGEYEAMIRASYRHRKASDKLMYVLAANDFNQGYRRFKYFQQFATFRRKQGEIIKGLKDGIDVRVKELEKTRSQKLGVIQQRKDQNKKLINKKEEQNGLFQDLKKKERQLKRELAKKQKLSEKLDKSIKRIIEEEARKLAGAKKKDYSALAASFEKNKGKFPWPTQEGLIISSFGEHPHPVLKYVKVRNNGVDIQTKRGSQALCIFKGEVSRIIAIPGYNNTVIIRHGNFLSVYANLEDVYVKKGDKVITQQKIGKIFTDEMKDNQTVLHFEIWKGNEKQNPESWLVD